MSRSSVSILPPKDLVPVAVVSMTKPFEDHMTFYEDKRTIFFDSRELWFTRNGEYNISEPDTQVGITSTDRNAVPTTALFLFATQVNRISHTPQDEKQSIISTTTAELTSPNRAVPICPIPPLSKYSRPTLIPHPTAVALTSTSSSSSLSPTPLETANTNIQNVDQVELSSGARVGISIGAAVTLLGVLVVAVLHIRRKRRGTTSRDPKDNNWNKAELPADEVPKHNVYHETDGVGIKSLPFNLIPQELDAGAMTEIPHGGHNEEETAPRGNIENKNKIDTISNDDTRPSDPDNKEDHAAADGRR